MGVTPHPATAWSAALLALLPPGMAWARAPGSILAGMIDGLAPEYARAEDRLVRLLDEADPTTALELLDDWERVAGLPDACQPLPGSIRERQLAVVNRLTATGGQSIAYFKALAGGMGFEIEIEEHGPFTCESGCDEPVSGPAWAFAWTVIVLQPSDEINGFSDAWFSCQSGCDEPLRSFGSGQLECLIRRSAPAHTHVLFAYDVAGEPLLWFDFL